MGKGVILGIDFSMDFTQIAFLDDEGNPKSISIGMEDNFLIPTAVCYNAEIKEWSAGDEALNKSKLAHCTLYEELPGLFLGENTQKEISEVLVAFFSYLIKLAVNYCNGRLIKNILITLDDVNPSAIENICKAFEILGYAKEDIKIISHSESFVYYVLNQNRDIWINKVYFLNFNRYDCSCRKLNVIKGRKPNVAYVTIEDLKDKISMEMLEENPESADASLADFMDEQLKKNVVSGVYLSGEGFYTDGWENTLSVVCRNRRVFKGNNLIVKGAVYGAKEFFYTASLNDYLISCKGRTKVKVIMFVKHKERESQVTLSNIGDYWYQARSKVECILEEPKEAVFEIQDIINHENEHFKVSLKDFPDRPAKTTRIEINFRYVEENKFQIEIRDLGFGEFFKSSEMVVRKEISLDS